MEAGTGFWGWFAHMIPFILLAGSFAYSLPAALHAIMTKDQVAAAVGWVGIIMLSPVIGATLYYCFGINRMRRRWRRHNRTGPPRDVWSREVARAAHLDDLVIDTRLGDGLSPFPMTTGNMIQPLWGGGQAYAAMIAAIDAAQSSIALQSYIFDTGAVGERFRRALCAAHARGVAVRVLFDAVGARYSIPTMAAKLAKDGIPVARFLDNYFIWHLPYANLRNHRKIMIVDGRVAFAGGMNIRNEFDRADPDKPDALDTHFRIQGPLVEQLMLVFEEDWFFTTKEKLGGLPWYPEHDTPPPPARADDEAGNRHRNALARAVPSGPDARYPANMLLMMGAIAGATRRVMICTPYFLPNQELIAIIKLAARRGVRVDVIVPERSNLRLVDMASRAQLPALLAYGCRAWKVRGPFDHSKIMVVDDEYAIVGSSNFDTRSLRLNFEFDMEVYHRGLVAELCARLDTKMEQAREETVSSLHNRHFLRRVVERCVWLFSPYL